MNREIRSDERNDGRRSGAARRAFVTAGVTIAIVLLLLLLWYAVEVLLLVFAGILLAIFLRGLSNCLAVRTFLSGGWSLALVVVALVAIAGTCAWLLAPRVIDQVEQLSQQLPRAIQQLGQRIEQHEWGRRVLASVPSADEMLPSGTVLSRATGIFSTALGMITTFIVILSIGIYLAVEPDLYTGGVIRLVPAAHRARAREVLSRLEQTLRWWLYGRIFAMFVVGVLTTIGLYLLGVPLALALGLIAMVLTFIPYIGAIIALLPALVFGLLESPTQALYVSLLYLAIQTIESYLLTPLVNRRMVKLPPALTITTQVLLGVLLGTVGIALASPLTAATLVLVKMLFIEDTLGDPVERPPHTKSIEG